jgi:hypothetical protein
MSIERRFAPEPGKVSALVDESRHPRRAPARAQEREDRRDQRFLRAVGSMRHGRDFALVLASSYTARVNLRDVYRVAREKLLAGEPAAGLVACASGTLSEKSIGVPPCSSCISSQASTLP